MMAAVPAEASTFAIPTAFQRLSSGAELVTLRPRVLWQRSPGRVLWNAKALKLPEIKKMSSLQCTVIVFLCTKAEVLPDCTAVQQKVYASTRASFGPFRAKVASEVYHLQAMILRDSLHNRL